MFANSYMAVIGKPLPVRYVKYSNDRAREFQIRTEVCLDDQGKRVVRKYPLTWEAREHVRRMAWACEELTRRYEGSGLSVNKCRLVEQGEDCWTNVWRKATRRGSGVILSGIWNGSATVRSIR